MKVNNMKKVKINITYNNSGVFSCEGIIYPPKGKIQFVKDQIGNKFPTNVLLDKTTELVPNDTFPSTMTRYNIEKIVLNDIDCGNLVKNIRRNIIVLYNDIYSMI